MPLHTHPLRFVMNNVLSEATPCLWMVFSLAIWEKYQMTVLFQLQTGSLTGCLFRLHLNLFLYGDAVQLHMCFCTFVILFILIFFLFLHSNGTTVFIVFTYILYIHCLCKKLVILSLVKF